MRCDSFQLELADLSWVSLGAPLAYGTPCRACRRIRITHGCQLQRADADDDSHHTATVARGLLAAASVAPVRVESLLDLCILRMDEFAGVGKVGCSSLGRHNAGRN